MESVKNLESTFARLRSDASIETMEVDDSFWPKLLSGHLGDFHNEYLVTSFKFTEDWPTKELHPNGDELVCLISGKAEFILEKEEGNETVELSEPGSFVFVPKGIWHTAKIASSAHMVFITAGEGTLNKEI